MVFAIGEKGNGGANHLYHVVNEVYPIGEPVRRELISQVKFQNGARHMEGSTMGVIDSDLLEIVRDRLICFQAGEFASDYNAKALHHIEEALMWMNRRVEDRIERNVLGTMNK